MSASSHFIKNLNRIARFLLALFLLNLIAALVWSSAVDGEIYYCSDEIGFGYLAPGDWVHNPVTSSDFAEKTGTMEDPDLIREGWSETSLWLLWLGIFGTTILLSSLFSRFGFDLYEAYPTGKKNGQSEQGIVPNP